MACSALDKVQPRAVSYEEQVAAIREQLAALYESKVGALCGVMLRCVSSCTGVACTVGCPALSQERRMLPMCCLLYIPILLPHWPAWRRRSGAKRLMRWRASI